MEGRMAKYMRVLRGTSKAAGESLEAGEPQPAVCLLACLSAG